MFKVNSSIIDRLIRLTLGEIFFMFAFLGGETYFAYAFYLLALAMLVTATTGFSLVYSFGHINTKTKTIPVFHKIPMFVYVLLPFVLPFVFWMAFF